MVLLHRTAPQQISTQPVVGLGVIPPQVQDPVLTFVTLNSLRFLSAQLTSLNMSVQISISISTFLLLIQQILN